MVIHKNFEHNALESDIKKLGAEIAEKKNLAEHKNLSEKELIKKTLKPMFGQDIEQSTVVHSKIQQPEQNQFFPDYLKDAPQEIKLHVKELVDSLFQQGIEKVIKRAKRASPFILDAFHDALTDKLHEELKSRKII